MKLKEKIAVVTGGNSGIGWAIATALAREGVNVVIAARRQKENQKLAADLAGRFGVRTRAIETNVAREQDCEKLIRETIKAFGTIHLLVNNAGIGSSNL